MGQNTEQLSVQKNANFLWSQMLGSERVKNLSTDSG
jgi:hypothetical protein